MIHLVQGEHDTITLCITSITVKDTYLTSICVKFHAKSKLTEILNCKENSKRRKRYFMRKVNHKNKKNNYVTKK